MTENERRRQVEAVFHMLLIVTMLLYMWLPLVLPPVYGVAPDIVCTIGFISLWGGVIIYIDKKYNKQL